MISAVIEFKDGKIITHDSNVEVTNKTFTKGFISCTYQNQQVNIKREELPEIHEPFESSETRGVFETCRAFFKKEIHKKVNALGFVHKLGILLYGKQGTGKTSLMNFIANEMVENLDAICMLCNTGNQLSTSIGIAKEIRKIQDNPIIFICDEFERFASDSESEMKNFLDGKDSIDNMLFIASTNYIDKVPETIKDRPSRFRVVVEINGITDKNVVRDIILKSSNKISPSLFEDSEINNIVEEITPCTLDEIKSKILEKVSSFAPIIQSNKKTIGLTSKDKAVVVVDNGNNFFPKSFSWDDNEIEKYDSNI